MGMVTTAVRTTRMCAHCSGKYQPSGNNQVYCDTCLGPSVETRWGRRWSNAHRLKRYGVNYPEWVEMVARFDGACWVCRVGLAEQLDHDHQTGKPRGAVCGQCNTRLAVLDDGQWIRKAQAYLAVVF